MLTDNGIQFADLPKNRAGFAARWRGHPFDRLCLEHGIEHRLTKPNHPWTNGQLERMNRTLKEATVGRSHFLDAYNFARRFKTLRGLSPHEGHLQGLGRRAGAQTRSSPLNLGLNT